MYTCVELLQRRKMTKFGINFVDFISEKFYIKEIYKCVSWTCSMLVFGLNGI